MIRVSVKYLNVYTDLTGKKEESVNLYEDLTLRGLLKKLAEHNPLKFREYTFEKGQKLKPHVWVLVNQAREKDLDRILKDGDRVVFSLILVGG